MTAPRPLARQLEGTRRFSLPGLVACSGRRGVVLRSTWSALRSTVGPSTHFRVSRGVEVWRLLATRTTRGHPKVLVVRGAADALANRRWRELNTVATVGVTADSARDPVAFQAICAEKHCTGTSCSAPLELLTGCMYAAQPVPLEGRSFAPPSFPLSPPRG